MRFGITALCAIALAIAVGAAYAAAPGSRSGEASAAKAKKKCKGKKKHSKKCRKAPAAPAAPAPVTAPVVGLPVDTTPPETTLTSFPDDLTSATEADFTYTSSEDGSTFQCSLDGAAFASCDAAGVSETGLADGDHTFEVRAVDAAGNPDPTPEAFDWTVDTMAPGIEFNTAPEGTTGPNTVVNFHVTSDEPDSTTYTCQLDEDAATTCAPDVDQAVLAATGDHNYTVTATDAAGNVDSISAHWTADATPPGIAFNYAITPPDGATTGSSATVEFSVTPAEPDSTTYLCHRDTQAPASCTPDTPVALTGLTPGGHSFTVSGTDTFGNANTITTNWTVS